MAMMGQIVRTAGQFRMTLYPNSIQRPRMAFERRSRLDKNLQGLAPRSFTLTFLSPACEQKNRQAEARPTKFPRPSFRM